MSRQSVQCYLLFVSIRVIIYFAFFFLDCHSIVRCDYANYDVVMPFFLVFRIVNRTINRRIGRERGVPVLCHVVMESMTF